MITKKIAYALILLIFMSKCSYSGLESSIVNHQASKTVLKINLLKYEPRTGTISSQLTAVPPQNLIDENSSINKNLILISYTNVNKDMHHVIAGEPFSTTNLVYFDDYIVDDSGNEFLYPFDTHRFQVIYRLYEKIDHQYKPIPLLFDCTKCMFEGYKIKMVNQSKDNEICLDFLIEQSMASKIIVTALNLIILILGVLILIIAIRNYNHHRLVEIPLMSCNAVLLFGIPCIRNLMPGIPPMGILIDYVGVFPGEICVATSLIILFLSGAGLRIK